MYVPRVSLDDSVRRFHRWPTTDELLTAVLKWKKEGVMKQSRRLLYAIVISAVLSITARSMAQHMPRSPQPDEKPMPKESSGGTFSVVVETLTLIYKVGDAIYGWAANCRDGGYCDQKVQDFPLVMENGRKVSHLPTDWKVGDCIVKAGATIEFDPNGTVRFRAVGHTTGTLSGDVWHQHFKGRDSNDAIVYQDKQQFRIPQRNNLPECNRPGLCATSVDETQNYDAGIFDRLIKIRWEAGC
jgi:hypothetical protein